MSFPRNLIKDLHCPYCGSPFEIEAEVDSAPDGLNDAVIRCDCYQYPVVRGIAVLRQMGPVSSTRNEAVECLKKNDPKGALSWLLQKGSAPGVRGVTESCQEEGIIPRIRPWLKKVFRSGSSLLIDERGFSKMKFEAALRASRPSGYADYLYHRFANPSLLAAIPLLLILGETCRKKASGRVVELLGGIGHSSAILGVLFPELQVVSTDIDFVNLFLGRTFVTPGSVSICIDSELPLPVNDSSVDGIFCVDGLHYVRSKTALLREVNRVVSADGIWLFAHMHNRDVPNPNPGAPLTADADAARFNFGKTRLLPEMGILQQFQKNGSLDLTSSTDTQTLASSHALTLFGARSESLWERHLGLDGTLCLRPDLIGFNPIYQVEKAADGITLRSKWPSDWLRKECTEKSSLPPEEVHISSGVVKEIVSFKSSGTLSEEIRKLLRSFVLVSLPECYPRKGFPGDAAEDS